MSNSPPIEQADRLLDAFITPMTETRVPIPTLERLAIYLRVLLDALEAGIQTLSSQEMEQHSGISAAQFRKDLSYFGEFGKPGVGYSVPALIQCIEKILRLDKEQPILLVGAGNIGSALVGYPNFRTHRLRIAAVFDNNFVKIGRPFGNLIIEDIARVKEVNASIGARLGIIAVPAPTAQEVADLLVEAGVRGILNFAPTILRVPPHVHVRNVSIVQELAVLSYHVAEETV
ncbi:MAG: redox-sensing transcriptional repressor Rex [Fimbriimonadales bacterium]